ncbi:ATP-binding cassette domain-containing protein [Butyrivibrio sp. JL13D10]|uniref:ATP-binding cassette domain-containing protein n=1 Tax=Butyrivibrio sp. JL13D10 TaxID=3236815 RepID=UPI0038B64E2D
MAYKGNMIKVLLNIMQMLDEEQIESALTEAFEALVDAVHANSGIMWLMDHQSRTINSIISTDDIKVTGFSIPYGKGIVGEVCENGDKVLVKDGFNDSRFPGGKDEVTGLLTQNALYYPMVLKQQVVGCVELLNRTLPEEFTKDEIAIVSSFSGLCAMIIEEKGVSYSPVINKKAVMTLRGIKKDYIVGNQVIHILKGIDLDIYEKEFLVILGESGCGKSTLLNIIGGMDSPTDGEIHMDGKDFSHPTRKELIQFRRDDIGFIFQAYNLMPNLTALENVKIIAEICKNPRDSKLALDMVGLTDRANNYPSMMSGGQQQRVSIARAIVKNPRIILADEPTAALDFTTGQEVLQLIESIIEEGLTTVVMVTHNVEIAKMANRVVHVKNGKITSIRTNSWPLHAADLVW